jgi:DNA replication protein DnaD
MIFQNYLEIFLSTLNRNSHIAMTEEFESEVQRMCNLSKGVYNDGVQQGLQRGIQQGIQQGLQRGIQQGIQQGEDLFAQLVSKLFALDRTDDAKRAAEDKEYRKKLMEEFQITIS